jgi:hypothetical protein
VKETVTNAPGFFAEMISDTLGLGDKKPTDKVPRSATEKAASASPGLRLVAPPPPPGGDSRAALPPVPAAAPGSTQNQNVNVNQTLNFQHDGADPKRTADSVKKAVRESYRQIGAQGQGS